MTENKITINTNAAYSNDYIWGRSNYTPSKSTVSKKNKHLKITEVAVLHEMLTDLESELSNKDICFRRIKDILQEPEYTEKEQIEQIKKCLKAWI